MNCMIWGDSLVMGLHQIVFSAVDKNSGLQIYSRKRAAILNCLSRFWFGSHQEDIVPESYGYHR